MKTETIKLLNCRSRNLLLSTIAKDLAVSESWLRLLSKGKINNPGIETIYALHDYLVEQEKNNDVSKNS